MCTYTWTPRLNTNYDCPAAGQQCEVIATATREDCEASCIGDWRCTGYDWNPNDELGQRCKLTGPWTTTINSGTAFGSTHYDLVRNFGGNIIDSRHLQIIFAIERDLIQLSITDYVKKVLHYKTPQRRPSKPARQRVTAIHSVTRSTELVSRDTVHTVGWVDLGLVQGTSKASLTECDFDRNCLGNKDDKICQF